MLGERSQKEDQTVSHLMKLNRKNLWTRYRL